MHELGIVVKVLEQVDAAAEEYRTEKILKVTMVGRGQQHRARSVYGRV